MSILTENLTSVGILACVLAGLVPLAGMGLALVARCVRHETHWSKGRVFNTAVALALNGFALYLALGRHHLIDWLEGQ